jgi:hypothetical protein
LWVTRICDKYISLMLNICTGVVQARAREEQRMCAQIKYLQTMC